MLRRRSVRSNGPNVARDEVSVTVKELKAWLENIPEDLIVAVEGGASGYEWDREAIEAERVAIRVVGRWGDPYFNSEGKPYNEKDRTDARVIIIAG